MENQSQPQQDQKKGMFSNISDTVTSTLSNVKLPQSVKDFGATCSRSYSSMSSGQKVMAGAALAVGAGLLANSQGWINLPKMNSVGRKEKASKKVKA